MISKPRLSFSLISLNDNFVWEVFQFWYEETMEKIYANLELFIRRGPIENSDLQKLVLFSHPIIVLAKIVRQTILFVLLVENCDRKVVIVDQLFW